MTELTTAIIDWSGTDEPIAITNIDVLSALAETDPNKSQGERTRYLEFGEHEYPLKHIVSKAIAHATGEERGGFHSNRAESLVEELGFETVRKESS